MPYLPATALFQRLALQNSVLSSANTKPNGAVQVVCAWPVSAPYGPGVRWLYYLFIALCIFSRRAEWLRNICLVVALLVPAVAALHAVVLASVHVNGAIDMDIYGAFQFCTLGLLSAPITVKLSRTYFSGAARRVLFAWHSLIFAGLLCLIVQFYRSNPVACVQNDNSNAISTNIRQFPYGDTTCGLKCNTSYVGSPLRQGSANSVYVIPAPTVLNFGTATLLSGAGGILSFLALISLLNKMIEINWQSRFGDPDNLRLPIEGTNGATLETMQSNAANTRLFLSVIEIPLWFAASLAILILGEINFFSAEVRFQTERMATFGQWAPLVGAAFAILGSLTLLLSQSFVEDDLTEKPIYHPLRESRFRLFALHPAFNNGSPISGDLQEFDMNEHPNYYALSYVWGQEPQIHQIQINDKGVMIRPNLFQALQRLRERYRDQPPYVWIDSLCINQADLDEKSIQVGRMAEIYQKAKRVIIWLGEEDFVSNSAMILVHQIARGGFNWHSKWWETYKLTALDQFLGRPWFRRRWIVQEAAFSVRSIVICGGASTPLDSLAYTVRLVRIRLSTGSSTTNTWTRNVPPNDIYPAFYDSPAMRLFALIDCVFQRSESGDIIGRRLHLETLVDMSTFCETSNQRDTIYALLSLAKEQEILSLSQPAYSLVLDYNKELIDVFAGFVLHCCHHSSSLDVICRPWAPGSTSRTLDSQTTPADRDFLSSLPSWIASKDQLPFGNPSLGLTQRLHGKHLVGRPPNPLESARRRGSSSSAEEQHGFEPPAPLGNNPKSSTPSHPEDSSSPLHRVRSRGSDEGRHDAPNGRTSTERGPEINPLHRAQVAATGRTRSEITPTITMLPQASTIQAIQARNRRKIGRALLAISDRLGAANPDAFDDSAFKRGPALDYPEYEGGESAHRYTYEMKEVPFALDRVYNAHYNTKPDVFLGRNPETQTCTSSLFAKGIMIGRIARRSIRMANAVIPAECFEVLDLSPRDQSDLWRILCADRDEEGQKAPPSFQAAFLERIAKSSFVREDGRLEPSTIGIDVEELLQGEGLSKDVKQYFAVVRDVIWNRRTFKAYPREGLGIGVIGLAPQDAKAGDDICILYGCSVPVVLRQYSENDGANSYWQLIGDAYVHNFMDGQGVQALPSDRSIAGEVLFEIR